MPTVQFGGLASGLDTNAIIDGLLGVEALPIRRLEARRRAAERARDLYRDLGSATTELNTLAEALNSTTSIAQAGASSSDPDRLGVSATKDAIEGVYEVEIQARARSTQLAGQGYADAASAGVLGTGLVVLDVGGEQLNLTLVAGQDSLQGLRDAINASGLDVQASILDDGSGPNAQRLIIRGTETGLAKSVTLDVSGLTGGTQPLSVATLSTAQDAIVVIDGLMISRSENKLRDVIPGVTLDLSSVTNVGETITVEVSLDEQATADVLSELIDAYRDIVNKINDASQPGAEGVGAGPLLGDALAGAALRRLQGAATGAVGAGSILNPADLGLTTDRSGNLELDKTKLLEVLESDPDSVAVLVADMAARLALASDELTTSGTGLFEVRADSLEARARDITRQIDRRETSLEGYEDMLRRRFTALEILTSRYQAQAGLLSSLTPIRYGNN